MKFIFTASIPIEFTEEQADNLEYTVQGAHPHVDGEWDGDYWVLFNHPESRMHDFLTEVRYIEQAGGIIEWENETPTGWKQNVNPNGQAGIMWGL